MITLNIATILNEREIKKHYTFLCANGFTEHTATHMLTHKSKSISFKHLEMLCTLLHCTPNDILVWSPDEGTKPSASQPLHKLTHPEHKSIITHGFRNLPLEELRELRKIMEEEVKRRM
jgi:DNA-binding Xre family transcriptional regulator